MKAKQLESVVKATVRIPGKGGQGVLIGGGFILTAAHCLDYDADTGAGITLGDLPIVGIKAVDGTKLKVTPWLIESVCDVALLGPLDNQKCREEVEALEQFCLRTKGVPIFRGVLSAEPVPVMIRSHKRKWITGQVMAFKPNDHRVWIEAQEQIEGGTSGGPIVTQDGKLVGIVSHFIETGGECEGLTPRPHLVLPLWASKLVSKRRFDGF